MYEMHKKKKCNKFYRTLCDFGECTSFHGVKYAVSKENTIYEKIFWIIVIILGFYGAVYMTLIFWNRYNSNPIRITIQSVHKQTSIIPFPGITICTAIRHVPEKVDKFLDTLNFPESITKTQVKKALPALLSYINPIGNLSDLMNDIDILEKTFSLNGNLSMQYIFSKIEPSCEEILLKCRWEQVQLPCEQLFRTITTKEGYCCSFNTNYEVTNFTIYRTLFYGVQMGLSLLINPMTTNSSEAASTFSSAGIKVLIHNPYDFPGVSSTEKMLANGTETYIRILGTKLSSSENVKSLTAEQRNCLYSYERSLHYFPKYRDTNCDVECRLNDILHFCNCLPFVYPLKDKQVCNMSDLSCLAENFDTIYRSQTKKDSSHAHLPNKSLAQHLTPCNCPAQCNDIFYAVQTSSIPLVKNINTITNFYNLERGNNISDRMAVHIYFGSYYQTEVLRDTITSTYYLLSSFGGVFSLFLGCSFISILEIIYFFCFRIFTKYNN